MWPRFTISSQGAPSGAAPLSFSATCRNSVSLISVDLPEPETPVTQVMRPNGMSTLTLRRLLPVAPTIRSRRFFCGGVRSSGTSMRLRPDRYWPVSESALASICAGVPCATTAPPCTPGARGRGQRRDRRREWRPSSCSTTITVLPRSRSDFNVPNSRVLSRWCRPDRWLVEDVHHAGEARADLARKADALAFAAGERVCAAIEREVVETHFNQELQPLDDLPCRCGPRLRRARPPRSHVAEELQRAFDGQNARRWAAPRRR